MLTAEELFEGYQNSDRVGPNRVHWQDRVPFSGHSGHYYFLRGLTSDVTPAHLAAITSMSGNAEVTLFRINRTYIIYVGNRGIASATFFTPRRQPGITSFRWLYHTHPQEMESAYDRAISNASDDDRAALERFYRTWGQSKSHVVVCRGGEVEEVNEFEIEDTSREPDGSLWSPTLD